MDAIEIIQTNKGKPCLVLNGYQHRIDKSSSEKITWVCLKDKKEKCKGTVKTDLGYLVLDKKDHTCTPNVADIETKKMMQRCQKRVREEVDVPVNEIFRQEMGQVSSVKAPVYSNVKTSLCQLRRRVLEGSLSSTMDEDVLPVDYQFPECSKGDGSRVLEVGDVSDVMGKGADSGERHDKPESMDTVEVILTTKGKPCLVINGYQHRIERKTSNKITWVCLKDKKDKCKGTVKTDPKYAILTKKDHTCKRNIAEIDIKKAMQKCQNRVMAEIDVPVNEIFKQEMGKVYSEKGIDFEAPLYNNVKTSLCHLRRKVLENPKWSLSSTSDCLFMDYSNDWKVYDEMEVVTKGSENDHQLLNEKRRTHLSLWEKKQRDILNGVVQPEAAAATGESSSTEPKIPETSNESLPPVEAAAGESSSRDQIKEFALPSTTSQTERPPPASSLPTSSPPTDAKPPSPKVAKLDPPSLIVDYPRRPKKPPPKPKPAKKPKKKFTKVKKRNQKTKAKSNDAKGPTKTEAKEQAKIDAKSQQDATYVFKGWRLVNMGHFIKGLQQLNDHPGYSCNFSNMKVCAEVSQGWNVGIVFTCKSCPTTKVVWLEDLKCSVPPPAPIIQADNAPIQPMVQVQQPPPPIYTVCTTNEPMMQGTPVPPPLNYSLGIDGTFLQPLKPIQVVKRELNFQNQSNPAKQDAIQPDYCPPQAPFTAQQGQGPITTNVPSGENSDESQSQNSVMSPSQSHVDPPVQVTFPVLGQTNYAFIGPSNYPVICGPDITGVYQSSLPAINQSQLPIIIQSQGQAIDQSQYPVIDPSQVVVKQETILPDDGQSVFQSSSDVARVEMMFCVDGDKDLTGVSNTNNSENMVTDPGGQSSLQTASVRTLPTSDITTTAKNADVLPVDLNLVKKEVDNEIT